MLGVARQRTDGGAGCRRVHSGREGCAPTIAMWPMAQRGRSAIPYFRSLTTQTYISTQSGASNLTDDRGTTRVNGGECRLEPRRSSNRKKCCFAGARNLFSMCTYCGGPIAYSTLSCSAVWHFSARLTATSVRMTLLTLIVLRASGEVNHD